MEYRTIDPVQMPGADASAQNFVICPRVCHADFLILPTQNQRECPVPGMIMQTATRVAGDESV